MQSLALEPQHVLMDESELARLSLAQLDELESFHRSQLESLQRVRAAAATAQGAAAAQEAARLEQELMERGWDV